MLEWGKAIIWAKQGENVRKMQVGNMGKRQNGDGKKVLKNLLKTLKNKQQQHKKNPKK